MNKGIEVRLRGTRSGEIAREFFTNSVHFPLVNIIYEMLFEGPLFYMKTNGPYIILVSALVQAYFLGSRLYAGSAAPFMGNLIGPALYTFVEMIIEGGDFLFKPNHWIYWGVSIFIGLLQWLELRVKERVREFFIIIENTVRTCILLMMYWVFEMQTAPDNASLNVFLADRIHVFVVILIPLLGLVIGFDAVTATGYLNTLKKTASELRIYSEWLLGKELLSLAVSDSEALILRRKHRTILFMDIRGFTAWSEPEEPERIVRMLNSYFQASESASAEYNPIKSKLSADEIMLVFASEKEAVMAALAIKKSVSAFLSGYGLKAGIGINSGQAVEGLMGSKDVKGYDIIGDSVNTAKRLCDSALGGEILLSEEVYERTKEYVRTIDSKEIRVKGKANELRVYTVEGG